MKRFVAAAMLGLTLLVSAPVVTHGQQATTEQVGEADQYEDAFSNPLRLAYYLVYPVGFTLEWVVMRPFHYLISRPYLSHFFGYHSVAEEGTSEHMGEHM